MPRLIARLAARLRPSRPRYGQLPDGTPTGLRVAPLTPAESRAARLVERAVLDTFL